MTDIVKHGWLLLLVFISIRPLHAEEPGAEFSAISYSSVPAGVFFTLEPIEQTLLIQQIVEYLKEALPKKGYKIDAEARYGMVVDAELVTPDYRERAPERWQLLHLTFPNRAPARRDYFISLAIYDKRSGIYIWRGEAGRVDETRTVDEIRPVMIEALVNAIGKNVKRAPIP